MNHKTIISFYFLSTLLIILNFLGACTGGSATNEIDWPRWRGANGDGISKETDWDPQALAENPKMLWTANIGVGYSNVAIKNGRLYTAGTKERLGHVFCLNADNGEEIWRHSFESIVEMQATPTVDCGHIYGLSTEGIVFCLREKDGKLRWQKDLASEYSAVRPHYGFAGSPVVEGNSVIFNVNTSGMALNKRTGQLLWGSKKPPEKFASWDPITTTGTDYCTPVVYSHDGERYALLSSWKGLFSVDVKTGEPLWLFEWELDPAGMVPDPVWVGTRIYIAQGITKLRKLVGSCIEVESGTPQVSWQNSNLWSTIATPVFVDGYIYGCQNVSNYDNPDNGSLRCLNAETGELCWEENLGYGFTLTAAAGKLIILTTRGMLHIAEATPSSYREISKGDVFGGVRKRGRFWTPPVLYKGKIFCRNLSGELFCIDVRKKETVPER